MNGRGLHKTFRTVIGLSQHMSVAPHFRIERGTSGIKYAHHPPTCTSQLQTPADTQAGIGIQGTAANDQFRNTWVEKAPLRDFDLAAHQQGLWRYATDLDIGISSGRKQRQARND